MRHWQVSLISPFCIAFVVHETDLRNLGYAAECNVPSVGSVSICADTLAQERWRVAPVSASWCCFPIIQFFNAAAAAALLVDLLLL